MSRCYRVRLRRLGCGVHKTCGARLLDLALPGLGAYRVGIIAEGTVALADRGWLETGPVSALRTTSVFAGFRFPPEVISVAVRWYLRYGLSYRDVEELLAERGVTVDHVTVYRWVQRFTGEFIECGRSRNSPGLSG